MTDSKPEFVYDGVLVHKTGRVAKKKSSKHTLRQSLSIEETIVEIIPVDLEDGTWKRWVSEEELFVVEFE